MGMFIVKMLLWCLATYWIVDKVNKDESSEFKANPWSYVGLTALFGFLCSMAFLLGNQFKFNGNKNAYIISYVVGFVLLALNFLIMFA